MFHTKTLIVHKEYRRKCLQFKGYLSYRKNQNDKSEQTKTW